MPSGEFIPEQQEPVDPALFVPSETTEDSPSLTPMNLEMVSAILEAQKAGAQNVIAYIINMFPDIDLSDDNPVYALGVAVGRLSLIDEMPEFLEMASRPSDNKEE